MNHPWPLKIRRLPFKSTYALATPPRVGAVMDGLHSEHWHTLQLFGFRLVLMWPRRKAD